MKPLFSSSPEYEAIVNSNALGVAMVSREAGNRIAFLSRHAARRVEELGLIDGPAESLIGAPAQRLADSPLLADETLANPSNYPAAARVHAADRELELAISPVFDLDDAYLGVMITFRDRSVDAQREADVARFQDHIGSLVQEAGARGADADDAGQQLSVVADDVQQSGSEISRLLEELGYLNSQAKLLALNARIEVHRTDDAEAFGVVADEIRGLAERMTETVTQVGDAAERVNMLSESIHVTSDNITTSISSLIESQRAMEASIRESANT